MSRGSTSSKIIEQKEIEESRLSIYLACSVAPPHTHTTICPRITVRPKAGNAILSTVFVFD